ncbi:MAG: NAD-dependent epimerase/dehydratase family protein, partial [Gammaproteobacteria bacterium]
MIGMTILGATGTIGVNTLDVLSRYPDQYRVIALTANTNAEAMARMCSQWRPQYAVMADPDSADQLRERLKRIDSALVDEIEILAGSEALVKVAALPAVDYVMAAIVGAAGLLPTLAAAQAGKRILLANKEALVMSGQLFMDTVARHQ